MQDEAELSRPQPNWVRLKRELNGCLYLKLPPKIGFVWYFHSARSVVRGPSAPYAQTAPYFPGLPRPSHFHAAHPLPTGPLIPTRADDNLGTGSEFPTPMWEVPCDAVQLLSA